MPRSWTVQTGARLHFGPLACGAESGRRFGGIGMMVSGPEIHLSATESHEEHVEGCLPSTRDRLTRIRNQLRTGTEPLSPLRWLFTQQPAEHSGFGTGTQVSLAVASILIQQATGDWPPAHEIAARLGRGARSAIGIHGFEQGGFLVDAGQQGTAALGDLAVRIEVPSHWRVLLIRRSAPQIGLSGHAELAAFEKLPAMPRSLTERLCRKVLMEILPALQVGRCDEFTEAVAGYGREVGEYFSPVQAGVFADPQILMLPPSTRQRLVQSSWGPTVVTFAGSPGAAEEERKRLLRELGADWRCDVVSPLNCGAIRTHHELSPYLQSIT